MVKGSVLLSVALGVLSGACTPIQPVASSGAQSAAGTTAPDRQITTSAATACDKPGETKCTGPDGHDRLQCQGGTWIELSACAADERCTGAGECRSMAAPQCAAGAGSAYCEGEVRRVCIDEGQSRVMECGENRRCRDLAGEVGCGCVAGAVDTGNGCQLATNCDIDMGGCDAASSCRVEAGRRVCGACPTGYVGDGETGCKPLLLALEASCTGALPIVSDVFDYRLTVKLLCQHLTLQPTLPVGAGAKLNGLPLPASGAWSTELLKLGPNALELSVTSASGIDTTYKITVERAGGQTSYIKASNPSAEDKFGYRIAIDGDTLIAAAPWEDGGGAGVDPADNNDLSGSGAAYVFRRQNGTWLQEAYLKADAPRASAYFGGAVAISGDMVAVGETNIEPLFMTGLNTTAASGSVYVYARTAGVWSFLKRLQASDTTSSDLFGFATLFDGDSLLVTAPNDSDGADASGAIYRYDRRTLQELEKVKAGSPLESAGLGTGLAIDGNTLVAAAWSDSSAENWGGSAYVFVRANGSWVEQQRLQAPTPTAGGTFSEAIAISGDTIAIGEASRPDSLSMLNGSLHVFDRTGTSWERTNTFTAPLPRGFDYFGSSIVLTPSYLAVGCNGDSSAARGLQGDMGGTGQPYSGALFLFARRGKEYELSTYIKPFNTTTDYAFATEAALAGEMLVVGSPYEGTAGAGIDPAAEGARVGSGAIYIFE
jgi:hypothetical protein